MDRGTEILCGSLSFDSTIFDSDSSSVSRCILFSLFGLSSPLCFVSKTSWQVDLWCRTHFVCSQRPILCKALVHPIPVLSYHILDCSSYSLWPLLDPVDFEGTLNFNMQLLAYRRAIASLSRLNVRYCFSFPVVFLVPLFRFFIRYSHTDDKLSIQYVYRNLSYLLRTARFYIKFPFSVFLLLYVISTSKGSPVS